MHNKQAPADAARGSFSMPELDRDAARAAIASSERRVIEVPLRGLEWRESGSGDGSRILYGYAGVHDQATTLYDGPSWRWDEVVDAGAFDAVLSRDPDVHLNIGHDMNRAMARTKAPGPIGKLELTSDPHGLRMYARLSPDDPDVQALAAKMDLGIMDQCSFAFTMAGGVTRTETTTDESGKEIELDHLVSIGDLFDVCVCARGAYPTTEASLRSLIASQGRASAVPEIAPARSQEVPEDVEGAQEDPAVTRKRTVLLAEGAVTLLHFHPRKENE